MKELLLEKINDLAVEDKKIQYEKCCGAAHWIEEMAKCPKFKNWDDLMVHVDQKFDLLTSEDWLEAFQHHPQIGDLESMKNRFVTTAGFAGKEQAAVSNASKETLESLKEHNDQYVAIFGFIFIVCASGKSAEEMLILLKNRIGNSQSTEIKLAANEQRKITKLRLENLKI